MQRRVLGMNFRDHVSNQAVRVQTGCAAVSEIITLRRLRFPRPATLDAGLDHHRYVISGIRTLLQTTSSAC